MNSELIPSRDLRKIAARAKQFCTADLKVAIAAFQEVVDRRARLVSSGPRITPEEKLLILQSPRGSGVSAATMTRWWRAYRACGLDGLVDRRKWRSGRPRKVQQPVGSENRAVSSDR